METILNNSALKDEVDKISEIAGYLWQKGWAERNGGNITVNVTGSIRGTSASSAKAIAGPFPIGVKLPFIAGMFFFCKGTNRRMRDLARKPMENGAVIRVCPEGDKYEIIADSPVMPTSELPTHLSIHNYLIERGSDYKAVLHTHPTELVAMSHNREFLHQNILSRLLWSMIPETRIFCPKGVGIVPYKLPGSLELAQDTLEQLADHDVVIWEKHGVCAVGVDIIEAFDMVDTLSKSAQIYMSARNMGFVPDGMTDYQMDQLKDAFNL